jgi:hypothetical protein
MRNFVVKAFDQYMVGTANAYSPTNLSELLGSADRLCAFVIVHALTGTTLTVTMCSSTASMAPAGLTRTRHPKSAAGPSDWNPRQGSEVPPACVPLQISFRFASRFAPDV